MTIEKHREISAWHRWWNPFIDARDREVIDHIQRRPSLGHVGSIGCPSEAVLLEQVAKWEEKDRELELRKVHTTRTVPNEQAKRRAMWAKNVRKM